MESTVRAFRSIKMDEGLTEQESSSSSPVGLYRKCKFCKDLNTTLHHLTSRVKEETGTECVL